MSANPPLEYYLINIDNYKALGISKYDTVGIEVGGEPRENGQLVLTNKEPYLREWKPEDSYDVVGIIVDIKKKKPEPIKSTIFDIIHS